MYTRLFLLLCLLGYAGWAVGEEAVPPTQKPVLIFKNVSTTGIPFEHRLFDAPCTSVKVRAHLDAQIQDEFIPQFKAARLTWDGQDYESCYIEHRNRVLSFDEDGAPLNPPFGIPKEAYQPEGV